VCVCVCDKRSVIKYTGSCLMWKNMVRYILTPSSLPAVLYLYFKVIETRPYGLNHTTG
jgi:hypothetical protein